VKFFDSFFHVELKGSDHRQETEAVVMSIEETELLGAMSGIVGRVHVDRNATRLAFDPFAMTADDGVGEGFGHGEEFLRGQGIFEMRQGRLRSQALSVDRIAAKQEFLNRIVGKAIGIITIGITGCDSVDPLSDKIERTMEHLGFLPRIANAAREFLCQAESGINRFQENRAPPSELLSG
jgi:hypothetical protein